MNKEPSRRAKDVVTKAWTASFAGLSEDQAKNRLAEHIQSALDAERAEHVEQLLGRISELEAWKESQIIHGLDSQKIGRAIGATLGTQITTEMVLQRIEQMAALLDRVPHDYLDETGELRGNLRCWADCPACAWAKLKEGK